jgi:hypothetical protein
VTLLAMFAKGTEGGSGDCKIQASVVDRHEITKKTKEC